MKSLNKLAEYQQRLKDGMADQIKPKHVQRVIEKLEAKIDQIDADLEHVTKDSKRERMRAKQATLRERIEGARWLLEQI